MSTRSRAITALALCAGSLQGCVATNLGDYCKGSGLPKVDVSSIGLVLGAPAHRFTGTPYATFYSPSQARSQASLDLALSPAALPWPSDLDETPCEGLDWRTFRVEVAEHQWSQFWSLPRPMQIEGGIGVTDTTAPLGMNEFGFAFVDVNTGKVLMSCGCYWT
jgi:hypothetical protein